MAIINAGDDITSYFLNNAGAQAVQVPQTDSGTVTSTSFTAVRTGTTNVAGTPFVAPLCGKVRVHFRCGVSNSGANFNLVSFEVRQAGVVGSGAVYQAANDNNSIQHVGTTEERWGSSDLVTGLTPGATYNVQLMYRTQAGTMTANRPTIGVDPQWT